METLPASAQDDVAQVSQRRIYWRSWFHDSTNVLQDKWHDLIVRQRRARRVQGNQDERRATRAFNFVQMGELSSGRQALEGAELAPGQ